MQRIERFVALGFGVMGALAAVLLGMGQQDAGMSVMPAAVAVVVTLGAVWVTDWNPWLRLGRGVSHAACLLAIVLAIVDVARISAESRVLALANLLLYLQCVQSLRQKDESIRWSLAALAVVQVAVASALNDQVIFLLLMLLYFVAAIVTMGLFVLLRDAQARTFTHSVPGQPGLVKDGDEPVSAALQDSWRGVRPAPLASFFGRMTLISLGIMMALFLAVPRVGTGTWVSPDSRSRSVGFTDRVRLGEMDSVREDNTAVMRVQFLRRDTREPFELRGEPLFRGSALTRYQATTWRLPYSDRSSLSTYIAAPRQVSGLALQEIEIEPLNTETLCALCPSYAERENPDLLFDSSQDRLVRSSQRQRERFAFQLLTALGPDDKPLSVIPDFRSPEPELMSLPEEIASAMPSLVALASETVQAVPLDDVVGRVRALENLLKNSGQFKYSLSPPSIQSTDGPLTEEQILDGAVDPMERFISKTREGNCEYFASALVLMARSQGIPARLVVGFRGSEYNRLGQFYVLRQLHAHSWAEIYLHRQEVPQDLPDFVRRRGGWMVVDPTPASGDDVAEAEAERAMTLREIWDFTKYLWSNYVIGLTGQRQWAMIYQPLWERIRSVFQREFWSNLWTRFALFVTGEEAPPLESWFNWRAGLVGALAVAVLVALTRAVRWLVRRWKRRQLHDLDEYLYSGPVIAFYRRMEELIADWSLKREPSQTQREFATRAQARFAETQLTEPLVDIPRQLVELFYRVRFGGRPLDSREEEAVEHALATIERIGAERKALAQQAG